MATTKQKEAARENIKKAQAASHHHAKTEGHELSERQRNDLTESKFAFPEKRKEPLTDADHVRNAVARFDQVENVSDSERDEAWKRIKAAADKYDVEIEASSWHELFKGGKAKKH